MYFIANELSNGQLTLKVLVSTIDAQWEGMGDVGSARYYIPHLQLYFIANELSNGQLTLKVLVSTIDAQWEGMGDVGSARY